MTDKLVASTRLHAPCRPVYLHACRESNDYNPLKIMDDKYSVAERDDREPAIEGISATILIIGSTNSKREELIFRHFYPALHKTLCP